MSEQTIAAISQKPLGKLLSHFGFSGAKSIPLASLQSIMNMLGIFSARGVDEDTAVALLKSYELKHGAIDDSHLRINRFHDFVKSINSSATSKAPFIDQVKTLGLLGKSELEEYGKDTGDWSHFLKRSAHDSKLDEVGPEAKIQ